MEMAESPSTTDQKPLSDGHLSRERGSLLRNMDRNLIKEDETTRMDAGKDGKQQEALEIRGVGLMCH